MPDLLKALEISQQMHRCHKAMSSLFGDAFQTRIETYVGYIRKRMEETNCGELEATIYLCHLLEEKMINDPSRPIALLMAACVEMIENRKAHP